jgi:hypothetical protein
MCNYSTERETWGGYLEEGQIERKRKEKRREIDVDTYRYRLE